MVTSLIGWIDYKSITLEHGKICLESNKPRTNSQKQNKGRIPPKKRRRQRINNVKRTKTKEKKRPQIQTEAH